MAAPQVLLADRTAFCVTCSASANISLCSRAADAALPAPAVAAEDRTDGQTGIEGDVRRRRQPAVNMPNLVRQDKDILQWRE